MTITIRKGIPTNAIKASLRPITVENLYDGDLLLAEGGGAHEHCDPIIATRMEVGI